MTVRVDSDGIVVLVWEREDHPVGYGEKKLVEAYGPFGSWDEAGAFARGLDAPDHQEVERAVLRHPALGAMRRERGEGA